MIEISGKQCALIDAHCHIFPDRIADKAAAATDKFYNIVSHNRATASCLIEEMERCKVDLTVVSSVATTAHQVDSITQFISDKVALNPDKLIGLGAYHQDRSDPEADVADMMARGLRGIKIHPDIQHVAVNDPSLMRVYEVCEARHFPVLIHAGDYRYDFSNPNRIIPVLEAFPELTLIGAHLGGWSICKTACRELYKYENFYVDTSSSFPILKAEEIKEIIRVYGADKVMFGTDYPMQDAAHECEILMGAGLEADELEKIFSLTAIKLFGLQNRFSMV